MGVSFTNNTIQRVNSRLDFLETQEPGFDIDIAQTFGRASIGYNGTDADAACFAHVDHMSNTNFALCHDSSGGTILNAATGQALTLSINDSALATVNATTLALNALTITSNDADSDFNLGRVYIGSAATDQAYFAHRDHATTTNYALRQTNAGQTVINTVTGQDIFFMVNNSTQARLDASNFDLNALEVTSDDGDSEHIFGRASIGMPSGATTDRAHFGHRDSFTATGYALRQLSTGGTVLNAPTGQTVNFAINGSILGTIDASNLDLNALEVTSDDSDTNHLFGRVFIGSAATDQAYFSHRDHNTTTNYAVRQSSAGVTNFNSASGQSLNFRINNSIVVSYDTSNVDITSLEVTSDDSDTTHIFGRGSIGSASSGTADAFYIAHRDQATSVSYAFKQTAGGTTTVNCGSIFSITFSTGDTARVRIDANDIFPVNDNAMSCGKSGSRWVDVWAVNSTIQTSDLNNKKDVRPEKLGLDFVNSLKPVSYRWKEGRYKKKLFHGLVAQDVKSAIEAHGIDMDDFAGYVPGDTEGLRYTEFISPIIKAIQELSDRLDKLS